jgi:hypothetical protein
MAVALSVAIPPRILLAAPRDVYKCSRGPTAPAAALLTGRGAAHGHAGSRRALLARNMHLTNRIYIIRKASETVSIE